MLFDIHIYKNHLCLVCTSLRNILHLSIILNYNSFYCFFPARLRAENGAFSRWNDSRVNIKVTENYQGVRFASGSLSLSLVKRSKGARRHFSSRLFIKWDTRGGTVRNETIEKGEAGVYVYRLSSDKADYAFYIGFVEVMRLLVAQKRARIYTRKANQPNRMGAATRPSPANLIRAIQRSRCVTSRV